MNVRRLLWLLLVACLAGACAKSPIDPAGAVTVAAPSPTFPPNGARIAAAAQPITLTVRNAPTTDPGVPVVYTFEVAGDKAFGLKILTKDVNQGANETSLTLDALPDREYFWHVRPLAGDTLGTFTSPVSFTITSASTGALPAPAPAFPPNGSTVASARPTLGVDNSTGSGNSINYWFEIATDAAFSNVVAKGGASAGSAQTSFTSPVLLSAGAKYYWHARAIDIANGSVSGFSTTWTFLTPNGP